MDAQRYIVGGTYSSDFQRRQGRFQTKVVSSKPCSYDAAADDAFVMVARPERYVYNLLGGSWGYGIRSCSRRYRAL